MIRTLFQALLLSVLLVSPARAQPAPTADSFVNFNFTDVDIGNIVKIVGEVSGKHIVLTEAVSGKKVTVVTPGQIKSSQVLPLFLSVLESNGLSVIDRDGVLHVTALPEGGSISAPVVNGTDTMPIGLVTKIIKLGHVNALELKSVLDPMVRGGKEGALAAFGPTNHLIITETTESLKRIEKIIADLDQPGASGVYEVIELKHASAPAIAREVTLAVKGMMSSNAQITNHLRKISQGGGGVPGGVLVVPFEQTNSLIIVGNPAQVMEVKTIVSKLDIESASGRGHRNIISLKYLNAEEAAKNFVDLLAQTVAKDQVSQIAVVANVSNNALIVDASPLDFEYIEKLVAKLDVIPQQVLVEVLIAEVAANKNLDFGVEWSAIDLPKNGSNTVIGRSRPGATDDILNLVAEGVFPQGLSLGVARGTVTDANGNVVPRIPFLLRALSQNRDVNILSNVPLWAQNNTESTVSVVNNIPVLRSTIQGGSGTARDVIQNVDRMDVGIKLSVTPLVNPDREITLKLNPSIEAIIDDGPPDQPFNPTIAKREVTTTVTIPDESTVIISGLIREDKIKEMSKVPLLGDIPFIGALFRSQIERTERTNLLVFVTPHIVTNIKDAERIRDELKEKTEISRLEPDPMPERSRER